MQLGTGLAALLELTLQPTEDMVKCQTAFPRGSHAATHPAHPCYALLGHLGAALLTRKVERGGTPTVARPGLDRG
jgi:hypothetical protein